MAIETREMYQVGEDGRMTPAGYARFDTETGAYLGSSGGYGNRYRNTRNGATRLQNNIKTVGARQQALRARAYRNLR